MAKRSEVKISNTLSTGTDSNFINYGFLKNNIRNVKFSLLETNKNKKIKKYYNEKINLKLIFKELTNFVNINKIPLL